MSTWPAIRYLRGNEVIARTLNRLPHWQQEGACYFLTFRLADSLPAHLLHGFREEREAWLQLHPKPWTKAVDLEYHRRFSTKIDRWLDAGHGKCQLAKPELSAVVSDAFHFFDGERYLLHNFVVMPNHVHLLLSLARDADLAAIVSSWKSFTARRINALESREGSFWQRDYFDRLIRDEEHFHRVAAYIANNLRQFPSAPLYRAPWLDAKDRCAPRIV